MRIARLQKATRSIRVRPLPTAFTPRFSQQGTSRFATQLTLRGHAQRTFSTTIDLSNTKPTMAPAKIELKTAKGTKDWDGEAIILRDHIFNTSE